ncbi:hypothetical protein PIB30_053798 [Stylosanthes scabra]|uniref:Uncharacterized protein n=1 Tax=Stylosanthes scabra TaxID=79078 RepID=A0ABU6XHR1_9FABA|nr:hypothetical protein [Stylosanthes scabra]
MGSGVIYYEYEKREKFEDHDMRADVELGTFKIRRYHFDNESFVHPLHSVRFDPDRPYEIPIEALMADKIASASKSEESSAERRRSSRRPSPRYSPRTMPVPQRERSTSSVKGARSFRRGDLDYDSEPERTLLRRRREARRRARQAALEQQLNMAAEHHDDNLNLENNQNRVILGHYINPTAEDQWFSSIISSSSPPSFSWFNKINSVGTTMMITIST